jgi:alpha-D-xyloside xylohydrolase
VTDIVASHTSAVCTLPPAWPASRAAVLPSQVAGLRVRAAGGEDVALQVAAHHDDVYVITARCPGSAAMELRVPLQAEERIVGFGEQFVELSQRGRTLQASIADLLAVDPRGTYYMAPLAYSSLGYALLVDTTAVFVADIGDSDPDVMSIHVPGDSLTAYVLLGTPRHLLGRVTELTGKPLPVPAWTFGVWGCMHSGTDSVLREAARVRELDIPCSAVWVDDPYDDATNSGCGASGTYPRGEYPDFAALTGALHDMGYKALAYLNCLVYRDTSLWREAMENGYLVRDTTGEVPHVNFFHPLHQPVGLLTFEDDCAALVDFTNPRAVAWWEHTIERLYELGWDGWMEDFGEQVLPEMVFADGSTGKDAHNRYILQYHAATARVRERVKPNSVFFVRAGYLGTQRHAPMVWGGDQSFDWSRDRGIASVIPAGISVGLTGVATWGPDITGIVELGAGTESGGLDKELWLRWLQLGALSPVMRVHLGFKQKAGTPVDMWTDEETTAQFKEYAQLHMRLFPYLHGLSAAATQTGVPVLRGMFVEHPDDPQCWDLGHQFMLGDAILVAPVLQRGARTREVYLPAGGWVDMWTGESHRGPGWVTVDAPLHRIPLLQRAGSVVPVLAWESLPQTLAGEDWDAGRHDVDLLVCEGPGTAREVLADGTVIELEGRSVRAGGTQSRGYRVLAGDTVVGSARGIEVRIAW